MHVYVSRYPRLEYYLVSVLLIYCANNSINQVHPNVDRLTMFKPIDGDATVYDRNSEEILSIFNFLEQFKAMLAFKC